ncbi:hypothetical protein EV127DRAFT_511206 [Xylaria flabelliformis]|nr:hypothetical protein EV127DRAFT_511206 [Xylaria flabelliformis]
MSGFVHKKVLLMGFMADVSLPQYLVDLFGDPKEIKAKIDGVHDRLQGAGIATVTLQLNPLEKEKGLADLKALLQEEKYDAIGIGAGLKLHPDYTAYFETIVNLCRTTRPSVPLMFTDGPDGAVRGLERVLGVQIQ